MAKIVAIILGGGRGQRLYPLTAKRAKPAVPFGGKFRLVDIPISNCIHAGLREIYILTQFNSASLHRHINNTYRFDTFSKGFVEVLAAEQTLQSSDWYQGTADAVRKNFIHFADQSPTHYLILSGDQLYRMDLMDMFHQHVESGSDITVAAVPVTREKASGLGILKIDGSYRITKFIEKPAPQEDISALAIPPRIKAKEDLDFEGEGYLASMGIYIFSAAAMRKALDNAHTDFGSQIIPASIDSMKLSAYVFDDYWEDIGTVHSFYEANIKLASINPDLQSLPGERAHLLQQARPGPFQDQLQHHLHLPRGGRKHHHQREYRQFHRRHPHDHRERREPRRRGLHGRGLLRDGGRQGAEQGGRKAQCRHRPELHHQEGHHRQECADRGELPARESTPSAARTGTSRITPCGTGSSSFPRTRCSLPGR